MGEEAYDKIDRALEVMPNLKGIDFSKWKDINIEPWQEYNREMLIIQKSSHISISRRPDNKTLEYLQEESYMFVSEDIFIFAEMYTTITWVLAYLGYQLATTAIVSIVDDWNLISVLKDNFIVEAVVRAKTPEIADKIYDHIVGTILPSGGKIAGRRLYSELEQFNVKLLERSAIKGVAFGIRKALNNLPSTPQSKWKITIAANRLSTNNNRLEAFKEVFPYVTDDTLTLIIERASSNIIKYIYDQKPYLRKSKK